jgi:hypothetical protein
MRRGTTLRFGRCWGADLPPLATFGISESPGRSWPRLLRRRTWKIRYFPHVASSCILGVCDSAQSPDSWAIITYCVLVVLGIVFSLYWEDNSLEMLFSLARTARAKVEPLFRTIFHWKYSSVFGVGIWFSAVAAMLSDKYEAATVFYIVGGLWLVGWWLSEHPSPRRANLKMRWTNKQKRKLYIRWFGILIPVCLTAIMFRWNMNLSLAERLEMHSDWLVPASDATPHNSWCPSLDKLPPRSVILLVGSNTAYAFRFPASIIKIEGVPKFSLDRDDHGRIAITADIFDEEDNAVVEIEHNHFLVDGGAFKMERPDISTLVVYARKHKEQVLWVRFLNDSTMQLRGTFRYPDSLGVTITDSSIVTAPNNDQIGFGCLEVGDAATLLSFRKGRGGWGIGELGRGRN